MKTGPILQSLKLGDDTAENDDRLDQYFVATSTFADVINDDADVVLGPKGSGKSAISLTLTAKPSIPQLADIDVLPAFNLHGSVIFRRLASGLNDVDEGLLRTAWLGYVIALAGNHIVDTYRDDTHVAALMRRLEIAGLRMESSDPKPAWRTVLAGLKRATANQRDRQGMSFGEKGARVLTGVGEYDAGDEPLVDLEELAEAIVTTLNRLNRRCWVVFDRLDEAFLHDRRLERIALRGLLRAYLDLATFGRALRIKLFLRTDLMDRITRSEGFVNATHFRLQRIAWDRRTLIDLVARRIYENEAIRKTFDLHADQLGTEQGRLEICETVLPDKVENFEAFSWIVQRSTDATGAPNPRNVLRLLREARSRQLVICDRDDPDLKDYDSLISKKAMHEGLRQLSKTRLEDTLFAEFNNLRAPISALRGRPFEYRPEDLAKILGLAQNSEEFRDLVEGFVYSGFMRESASGRLSVPLLYRYALEMQTGSRDRDMNENQSKRKRRRRGNSSAVAEAWTPLPASRSLGLSSDVQNGVKVPKPGSWLKSKSHP